MSNEELRKKTAEILAMAMGDTIEKAMERLGLMDRIARGEEVENEGIYKVS